MKIRKLDKQHIVLENPSKEDLINHMKTCIKQGKFRLNPKYGYSVEENITHYENIYEGERWQGILQKK